MSDPVVVDASVAVKGFVKEEAARQLDLPLITADARLIRKFAASPYAASILPLSDWRP